jgi:hypothetical protein
MEAAIALKSAPSLESAVNFPDVLPAHAKSIVCDEQFAFSHRDRVHDVTPLVLLTSTKHPVLGPELEHGLLEQAVVPSPH